MNFWRKFLPRQLKSWPCQPKGRKFSQTLSQQELLDLFRRHLEAEKTSPLTVKNYLSDLRHFLGWLTLEMASHQGRQALSPQENQINPAKITSALLLAYKNFLFANRIAKSTIHRRLATIRRFCQFCQDKGLSKQNPAVNLTNAPIYTSAEKEIHDLVSQFGAWLKENGASRNTIKNYTADVRQYLLKTMA